MLENGIRELFGQSDDTEPTPQEQTIKQISDLLGGEKTKIDDLTPAAKSVVKIWKEANAAKVTEDGEVKIVPSDLS